MRLNNVAMMADFENNITLETNSLTLKIKVNYQGQVTDHGFSEILEIENVRIDTKIESVGDKQDHRKNMYDLEFQSQPFEIRELFQHFWYPRPRKC